MALSPIKALAFGLLWAFWVSVLTEASLETTEIPPCEGWDVVTGCEDTRSRFLSGMVLGTIPGAPGEINAALALLGLLCRGVVIWGLIELARGV